MLEHLGLVVDTRRCLFLVPPSKVIRLESFAASLVVFAIQHSRRVPASDLRKFVGMAISVMLAVPLVQFYTRALYDCLGQTYVGKVQLGHPALKDLKWWSRLGGQKDGRALWDHS